LCFSPIEVAAADDAGKLVAFLYQIVKLWLLVGD
jgi:hypothetical protein